ncbi:MAG TPA: TatD family hydrolase [Candidatus Paceibacterota bacterium]|nr:TatD family hydrolase [Candidatus Paceibacterota bacterium]
MKYFDAHTHVQFVAYDADRDEVIARTKEAEVGMNVVGTQLDTSRAAVELAEKYDETWASVALHPVHTSKSHHDTKELGSEGKAFTSRGEAFDFDAYEKLAKSPKVIAIGECGLDYYRLEENTKKLQTEVFLQHIELANKLNKPLMLHIRDGAHQTGGDAGAYMDAIALLKSHTKVQGDVHFFAGDWNIAKQFLGLGFTLSFTGVLTFTHDYDEVVQNTPLDMLLTETDAPYITPVPYRGTRNEPMHVREVVKRMAELKNIDTEAVRSQILQNSKKLFAI